MAVETMKMMGFIGKNELMNKILRQLVLDGSLHAVNALVRINSSDFKILPTEKNIEALEELPFLKSYSAHRDFSEDEKIITGLMQLFGIEPQVKLEHLLQDYDYDKFIKEILNIDEEIRHTTEEIQERERSIEEKREYISNLSYLKEHQFDMGRLAGMKYLTFRLLKITKENYEKLKKNYENIPAVVMKVGDEGKDVVVATMTPVTLEETVNKILDSLNYTPLALPDGYGGLASEVIQELEQKIQEDERSVEELKASLSHYKEKYASSVEMAFSRLQLEKQVEDLKSDAALGKHWFFMFGFVPENCVGELKAQLESSFGDDLIILVDDIAKSGRGITPPTQLRNVKLFKPFELLVKMYGIPAYDEKDPTVFFAITYMLLFGAMFGDVGQGLVMLVAGLILEKVMSDGNFGGILARLGFSSTIFGFLYGSVFGSEDLIPALVIRPMANINTMLVAAVLLGVLLLVASTIWSILNACIQGNIEEGLFGRNGWAGLGFYLVLIYSVIKAALGGSSVSPVSIALMLGFIALMVLKQPLAHKIEGMERLYDESAGSYFMEEGFGVVETLLSTLSNTISFIRVGAFALNHVGLYIAFETVGEMMGSQVGNIAILILGNVIIIGLEGLVVFIQALRLEYYELFSKFYKGDGIEYRPVKLKGLAHTHRNPFRIIAH